MNGFVRLVDSWKKFNKKKVWVLHHFCYSKAITKCYLSCIRTRKLTDQYIYNRIKVGRWRRSSDENKWQLKQLTKKLVKRKMPSKPQGFAKSQEHLQPILSKLAPRQNTSRHTYSAAFIELITIIIRNKLHHLLSFSQFSTLRPPSLSLNVHFQCRLDLLVSNTIVW